MQIIPLLELNNREIQNSELLENLTEDDLLYIIDLDGIEKDKPNLCHYQKLSKEYQLWIDNAPRTLGDVVDAFLAGAVKVTIRKTFYPQVNLESIREITENKIYANIEMYKNTELYEDNFFKEVDGLVNFYDKETLEKELDKIDVVSNYSMKNKIHFFERDINNVKYWEKFNPEGFIVDLLKFKEFKQKWPLKEKQ
jgi:hypothetical protein